MAQTVTSRPIAKAGACQPPAAPLLDAEKLDVYRVALAGHAAVAEVLSQVSRVLRDQLERASLSVVLNIAEGAGRRSRADKRRHYAIARGSAMEVAAALDVLCSVCVDTGNIRRLYVRVVQMLTRLDQRLA